MDKISEGVWRMAGNSQSGPTVHFFTRNLTTTRWTVPPPPPPPPPPIQYCPEQAIFHPTLYKYSYWILQLFMQVQCNLHWFRTSLPKDISNNAVNLEQVINGINFFCATSNISSNFDMNAVLSLPASHLWLSLSSLSAMRGSLLFFLFDIKLLWKFLWYFYTD